MMSNYGISAVEAVGMTIPENLSNDPVTKAVYDNILGNIPLKKKVTVYCKVCSLEFSSQVVLDTHLAGSKHQRKLQSKELMKNLEETESGFERNNVSGVIRCTICDVTVNSPQLLAAHVAGNKHKSKKGKRENGEEGGTPAKKLCPEQSNGMKAKSGSGANMPPKKKERVALDINIPSCVTKLEDTKAGGKFLCNPCQAHCNSDVQLSQHLSSKKHIEKVSGRKKMPPTSTRGSGSGRGWRGSSSYSRGGRGGSSSRGGGISSKWGDSLSSSTSLLSSAISSYSATSSFPETSLSNYSDSYGLSSLGRGTSTDYSSFRSGSTSNTSSARGGSGRGSGGTTYGRSESYVRSDGGYGRGTSSYGRTASVSTEVYPRSDYGTEYQTTSSRTDDLSSYSRAATDYAAQQGYGTDYSHGYGSTQSISHASHNTGRSMPFTYTQPLSQNFVSGGSIM